MPEVLTSKGFKSFEGVRKTFNKDDKFKFTFNDGSSIKCTKDHLFMNEDDEFIEAKDITNIKDKHIISKDLFSSSELVYDLINVKDTHHYYTNGVISHNCVFLDEFAFVQSGIAEDFFRSVYPTISSGKETKVIIVSTPNGLNHFYKMWVEAEEGRSNFIPFKVHWSQVPGRDEKWKEETIANTSPEQFEQEHEASFLGSSNTLINTNKLQQLVHKTPILQSYGLDVYEETIQNHQYMISVDTAEGRGQDYSTMNIIDVTEYPFKQVAVYRSNTISPLLLPNIINEVALKYNNADVIIERDSVGQEVLNILNYDLEYENIIALEGVKSSGLGVKMTKKVKSIGTSNLKDLIENNKLIIQDINTISELSAFVMKGRSFAAEEGGHDDIVMSLVLFAWFTSQDVFKDLTNQDVRNMLYEDQMKRIEDEMLPFGLFDDGQEEENTYIREGGEMWQLV